MISQGTITANRNADPMTWTATRQTCWEVALVLPVLAGPVWCLAWRWQASWIGTLSGFVLLALLVTCAATDLGRRKIYNWATYSAVVWALAINLLATMGSLGDEGPTMIYRHFDIVGPRVLGGIGLEQSLGGAGLCFLMTLIGFHLSGTGAGDVKLATAIGALLGTHGVYAVAYSYIVAAAAIVCWSVYNNGPLALVKAAARTIGNALGPLWPFPPTTADNALLMKPIPLGPYFAVGTLLVILEVVPT